MVTRSWDRRGNIGMGTAHTYLDQAVIRNQFLRHGTGNRLVVGTVHVTLEILRSDSLSCLLSSVFA